MKTGVKCEHCVQAADPVVPPLRVRPVTRSPSPRPVPCDSAASHHHPVVMPSPDLPSPLVACPPQGCLICLTAYDVFALTLFALVSWFLLMRRIDPAPNPSQVTKSEEVAPPVPEVTRQTSKAETHRFHSLTVPRRPRRAKKLIRADLDLRFSDPDSDSEEGLQSIDYSSNFMSLNERDLAKSLADFRDIQIRLSRVSSQSTDDSSNNSSSSNNPSILNSGHTSCDSLRETDDLSQSFLSDTLRNRYHILYDVFHSQDKALDFVEGESARL